MATFFVTTNVRGGEKSYQFSFETTEAATVDEFAEVLEGGGMIVGESFNPKKPDIPRRRMALAREMVGMVQEERAA